MKRKVLIEVIVLWFIGLCALAEGGRLVIWKDPFVVYDSLGPGFYIIILGFFLLTLGTFHLVINYRKIPDEEKSTGEKKEGIRIAIILSVFALYALLVEIVGYGVASFVYFLLIFRVVGIKYWPTLLILSIALSLGYYFIFAYYCNIFFPTGILFK